MQTPQTWYQATAHSRGDRPPLTEHIHADIVVIGAGLTGVSAALTLAEKGYKVVLLERHYIGYGASGRNGGHICTGYTHSQKHIAAQTGPSLAKELWHLSEEAKQLIRQRTEHYKINCDLRWGYVYAALKSRHLKDADTMLAEWNKYNYHHGQALSSSQISNYVNSDIYLGGLLDNGGGQIHSLNYLLGMAEAAESLGAKIYGDSGVISIDETPSTVTVKTAHGCVSAKHAILAGNALLGRLVPELKHRIMPVATAVITTNSLSDQAIRELLPANMPIADMNFILTYFRATPDNRILLGGGASYANLQTSYDFTRLEHQLRRIFPQTTLLKTEYHWHGLLDITVSRLPHIGKIGRNLYFAQGFSGQGVSLTGITGHSLALAIAGQSEKMDIFSKLKHWPFPGGPLRTPVLAAYMLWARLKDWL